MFAPEPDEVISKGRTVQHHAVSAAWVLFAGAAGRSSLAAVLGQIAGEDPVSTKQEVIAGTNTASSLGLPRY